jgi:hypothetical protein
MRAALRLLALFPSGPLGTTSLSADLRQVKPSISAAALEMYIYECISPGNRFLASRHRRLATTSAGTIDCAAPTAAIAIAFLTPKNSEKFLKFFATRTTTRPSVGMNTIHFARAVIHKRPLVQMLRAPHEKFPSEGAHSPEFFKISADADLPMGAGNGAATAGRHLRRLATQTDPEVGCIRLPRAGGV